MLELIGLGEDLVARTCDRVGEGRQGGDLSATAVVFPSRRFGFFLGRELASRTAGNFFPPALFPIEAFFESLFTLNFPGQRILDDLESARAVHESARAVFRDGMYGSPRLSDFAAFLPWAQKILAALEEILTEGGRISAADFGDYEEFAGLGDYHRSYKEFILKIPDLLADLKRRLGERRQATRGMAARQVADLAETGELLTPPASRWIFSGFNAMNACERKLFLFFHEKGLADLILRTDARSLDDPLSPFHLQAETIRSLGLPRPDAPVRSDSWDELAAKVTIHPCDGVESEIFLAYSLLEKMCRGRDEAALRKIAVLLPSPPSLIPFVQGAVSRFDQDRSGVPFNITLGYPLERTPMMQLVEALLAVLENAREGTIAAGDYLRIIRHPYVKISGGGDQEPLKRGIHLLENIIDGGNLTRVAIPELEALIGRKAREEEAGIAAGLAEEIVAQVGGMHRRFIPQGLAGMKELLAFLRLALESAGSEGNRGASLFLNEYAAAALAALEELEDFAAADEGAFHGAGMAAMAALVRAHFRGRVIRFEGSPLQGVQVMGPLEFRGLAFDEVIVLDAVEGVLPGTAKYDPILPADIRAVFKIRDHGDWERIYALNFFSMLGAAGRVHILYPRRGDDGQECERSRFIERIAYAVEKETGQAPAAAAAPLPFAIRAGEPRPVRKGPAIRERLAAIALHPSALATYVKCPLQFYFRTVLGLREREEVAAETEGSLLGTIAHGALCDFYKKYPTPRKMAAAGEEELDADLERCLHDAFRKLNFEPEKGLERVRAWTLNEQLRLFVREDRQRLAAQGVRIGSMEADLAMELAVPGLERAVPIKGRPDRWETDGRLLRVIDYKTGTPFSPRVRLEDEPRLENLFQQDESAYAASLAAFRRKYPGMQIQIYLMLLARKQDRAWDEIDAAYVFLRERGGRMVQGIFRTGGRNSRPFTAAEQHQAMASFVRDLGEVLRDLYLRPDFIPDPTDAKTCGWCPFRLPCGSL